jgi:O-methyltransferase
MWKAHRNTIGDQTKQAAHQMQAAGFLPAKLYGHLAQLANRLKLPALGDNVRFLQMALLSQEIDRKSLGGAVAELGVYRGGFTKYISRAFNGRRYYLFDTFEGFDEHQIRHDTLVFAAKGHDFSDTSAQRVMEIVDKDCGCEFIVKKGVFPSTTTGVNEQFVFVSLDADLYTPTIEGLNYFYPRMVTGGYIMIHDLMANRYQGCREAIYEFCDKNNISFVPLPDAICSALILK